MHVLRVDLYANHIQTHTHTPQSCSRLSIKENRKTNPVRTASNRMRWAAQACHCYSDKANSSAIREGYLTDSHPTRLEALRRPGQALENL
eukprot:6868133-Pyramimonas_sp.AAC.1